MSTVPDQVQEDPGAGDLLSVAHAFETIATPGANDNCAGVGTTLEIGRTLARLIRDGVLPQPRRTLRFLWVPEISGSRAYMFAHPELEDRLLAAMNYDKPATDLEKTDSYLRLMKMTPDSVPSFLNDLVANLLQFVDQTEIRTPTGNNAPFNYRLTPLPTITSGSDHSVFLAAAIPAMQNVVFVRGSICNPNLACQSRVLLWVLLGRCWFRVPKALLPIMMMRS